MDDDFVKKRLERDLADLKRMCDDHFKKREEDDSVVTDLEKRIADRQTVSFKNWSYNQYDYARYGIVYGSSRINIISKPF